MKHRNLRILLGSFVTLAMAGCSGDLDGGGLSDGSGAGTSQGGNGQGASSQGASSQGASSQGGAGQGASSQGGDGAGSQGGSGQGASGQGGAAQGGQGGSGQGAGPTGGNGQGAGPTGGNGQGAGPTGGNGQGAGPTGGNGGQGGAGPVDPYAAARTACINKINSLRATVGAPAYAQWTAAEQCADDQATSDEQTSTPHGAFGQCGENGQNECLGAGVAGIENCLQNMWDERNQPDCAGCDACANAYDPNCPNCDFYGAQNGQVCGHYVNMRALYFTQAACGFSALGGWDVIDFQ